MEPPADGGSEGVHGDGSATPVTVTILADWGDVGLPDDGGGGAGGGGAGGGGAFGECWPAPGPPLADPAGFAGGGWESSAAYALDMAWS